MNLIELAETGLVPDPGIRAGIRHLLGRRRKSVLAHRGSTGCLESFAEQLRQSPLAVSTESANRQHYEVPVEFFRQVLGRRLKYSACYFAAGNTSLDEAEDEMLRQTCQRAEIEDGMRILELGCGWGSLTLWIAEHFPNCQVTAVSNSVSQRKFIESRAESSRSSNIRAITADMRKFSTSQQFDRVVSVEMFEHMRNYDLLLRRVASWLTPQGKAFVHIFCHRDTPYLFETKGAANWMGRHFFTGGMMPSQDLFRYFDQDLVVERQWHVGGLHYGRTCQQWLRNLDQHRDAILAIFRQDMSWWEAKKTMQRWRIFFMACAELFQYQGGHQWFVSHYRFTRPPRAALAPDGESTATCRSAALEGMA